MTELKKNFLVDVPVRVNVWIRPKFQQNQFDVLKIVRPSVLFLVSDGPRNENDKLLLAESRKIVEQIDWECTIYKIYEDNNNGMYRMAEKGRDFIFQKVERCIFLEDDYVPSISYFQFCSELLEKYKNDERVLMINGMNHLGTYDKPQSDYFFSHAGSIWGIAYWKRTYERFKMFEFISDDYVKNAIIKNADLFGRGLFARNLFAGRFTSEYLLGTEFHLSFVQITQNQLIIVPSKNMISNIGCDENASHANILKRMPVAIRKVFNMKVYEYSFPLNHPKFIVPDMVYTKHVHRLMGVNYPLVKLIRSIETLIYRFIF